MAVALVDHEPIVIDGDTGFTMAGFPGSGTVNDPYRIEGLHIVTDSSHRNGVEVKNTGAYFVVEDCLIEADYIGVLVTDASTGTALITDNVIVGRTGDGGGISLECDGAVVVNNTCVGFAVGLHTNYADGCRFEFNNFSINGYHGLNIRYSDDCTIQGNTVVGNGGHGVFIIRDSTGNLVYNNTVTGNGGIGYYEWDNLYSYNISSQGCDEGTGNIWYNEETETGNVWGDYNGEGVYRLDGGAGSVDKYPVNTVNLPEESGIPGFGFLSVVVGLLVIGWRYRFHRSPPGAC